jgi:excisionase family DNA binding protein
LEANIEIGSVIGDWRSGLNRAKGGRMTSNDWNCDLMTVAEIAAVLHVPTSWVYERTRRRGKERIPHIKLGKYLRFEIASVRDWLNGLRNA